MTSPSTPTLDGLAYKANSDLPGDLAILALAVAARESSLENIARNTPELTAAGYDSAHVALIEAHAVITAQLLFRTNQVPAEMRVQMLEALGYPRRGAGAATVDVYVDNATPADVTWVQGAAVGGGRVMFEVARTVTVPAGAVQYGPVPLVCMQRGPVGNVQANLRSWAVVTPVPLTNISNPSPGQRGAHPESDADYLARGAALLTSRGAANRAADAEAFALSIPGIERVLVLEHTFLTTGARWGYFPWDRADWGAGRYLAYREGVITVVARALGGGYLSTETEGALRSVLDPLRGLAGLIHVVSPEEVKVDTAIDVRSTGEYAESALQGAIERAVRGYLSGATWGWGAPLRAGELSAVVARVPGVREVLRCDVYPDGEQGDLWTIEAGHSGPSAVVPLFPNVLFIAGEGVSVRVER